MWVIHEDGLGPRLDEFRFDIFVPTEHGLIAVGTALPTLYGGTPAYGSLTVRADGRSTETEPVLHLDRYVATEFRAGYDGVVFKAVAAAVIRVLVQAELQKGSDSSGFFGGAGQGRGAGGGHHRDAGRYAHVARAAAHHRDCEPAAARR